MWRDGTALMMSLLRAVGWMNVVLRHLVGASLGAMVLIVALPSIKSKREEAFQEE